MDGGPAPRIDGLSSSYDLGATTVQGLLSHRAAGALSFSVEPRGASLAVEARVDDTHAVEAVSAHLLVIETAWHGAGTDRASSLRHEVHRLDVPLAVDVDGGYRGTVPVGAAASLPPTMTHATAAVEWWFEVHVALRGAPDLVESVALVARSADRQGLA